MFSRIRRISLAASALALVVTLPAAAQQAPQPEVADSVGAMFMEFQRIQQELGSIQQRAVAQNPALVEAQGAVEQAVEEAMLELHPELTQTFVTLDSLGAQLGAARETQDTACAEAIMAEGMRLQEQVQAAEAEALAREDVKARVESFRTTMLDEMTKVDPKTPELLARLETLVERLQQAQPAS